MLWMVGGVVYPTFPNRKLLVSLGTLLLTQNLHCDKEIYVQNVWSHCTVLCHYFLFLTIFLLFLPMLENLATARCCGENWMNNCPWETNNIMDPECLLSVMRPNRRLDRRKWCGVLCWDNSPSPPRTIAAQIWSVHKPQFFFWVLKGLWGEEKTHRAR